MITQALQEELMQHCCSVAMRGLGFTSPNPIVGALLADINGNIISEGWHHNYGSIHAEVDAIKNAELIGTNNFSDLYLFVTLEPCNHFGKQPPCTDFIIKSGIKNVIIGIEDPNPIVKGKGIEKLRTEGINVIVNVAAEQCSGIISDYIHYITKGMPYVTMKIAQSLDGYIASTSKNQKYITSEISRKDVHFFRSFTAILVGINTILIDNPILDNRLLDDNLKSAHSKIIILDSNLRTPISSSIFSIKNRTIFIAYSENLDTDIPEINDRKKLLEQKGAILIKSAMKNDKIHLRKLLSLLALKFNIIHIYVEGGGQVFTSFANSELFNELIIYSAPIILGNGLKAFPNVDKEKLNNILEIYENICFMKGKDFVQVFTEKD